MLLNKYEIIIVGCGLSGIVMAEKFSFDSYKYFKYEYG